jgi:methyl-accepting chemotaxis protein
MTSLRPDSKPVSRSTTTQSAVRPKKSLSTSPSLRHKITRKLGIRTVVIASFVVPIVTAVGLTGWLSIRNGQKSVDTLVNRLSEEVTGRVSNRILSFADTPYQFLQINSSAVRAGNLRLNDAENLAKYFWYQIQITPAVPYVYYANEAGDFVGVWKQSEDLTTLRLRDQSTAPNRVIYELDETGQQQALVRTHEYDPRPRPWYQAAVQAGAPTWSDIYVFADPPSLGITHVAPLYGQSQALQGVMAIDLTLADISDFLQEVDVSQTGEVFILERSGDIVASSVDEAPFIEGDEEQQRLAATASSNPLIQAAAQNLLDRFGSLDQIQAGQRLSFEIDGQRHYLQVTPVQDGRGLDWLMAVVIPESDFMAQINASTRNTIVLCLLALAVATGIGIITSRQITGPLVRMSQASQAIAAGDFDQTVAIEGIGEINVLAQSFNQMADQLQKSFVALESANQELEQRVAERTAALNQQTQALQDEVEHLLDIVSAVEEGDLTVVAEVSPSVTGLVADTFNRLIERFGQIMATVSGVAEQINQGAEEVETLAKNMADNAYQQASSVVEVQSLMENINDLSQSNVQRVIETDDAMAHTQQAVEQGQQEIAAVTEDIDTLQQETQQIVARAQTLTSYADLAAKFVKDQKRIASLTRVLSMNASMLSTRASQQQDPSQFAAITREFEAIAAQVNDLASQTNQSLIVLQQRTDQIQTVVSGLNHDVESISQRTDSLTTGIDQSNQAFNQIKTATSQVALLSEQVTQSSQAIAAATQITLKSVREISEIATETSNRANLTKEESQTMEQLARTLRQNVASFQLPIMSGFFQNNGGAPSRLASAEAATADDVLEAEVTSSQPRPATDTTVTTTAYNVDANS